MENRAYYATWCVALVCLTVLLVTMFIVIVLEQQQRTTVRVEALKAGHKPAEVACLVK